MPVITSVKPQKDGKRINIYLDGEFGFGIDLENYVAFGLRAEKELTEEEVEKIVSEAEYAKSLNRLLNFATLRPRSRKEIGDYMKRKEVPESLHQRLWGKLEKLGLADDKAFAEWWVGQRATFKPKSVKALAYELYGKGVARDVIEKILTATDINETDIAVRELEKRGYKWKKFAGREKEQKMGEFLGRKGFDWDTIKSAIKKYLADTE